ncbi:MAG TPA: hypothetical protein VMZ52_13910 [Bryobacteraceae bacterium]|nr:hypothetical protein [Bryobacteraceae bacterium]
MHAVHWRRWQGQPVAYLSLQSDQIEINATRREQLLALATDLPRLWNDPATANRERKRMVRLLIEDINIGLLGGSVTKNQVLGETASDTLLGIASPRKD